MTHNRNDESEFAGGGTERNDGLNRGTEHFLNLKLAGYHCC